jgi:hypothetical protein
VDRVARAVQDALETGVLLQRDAERYLEDAAGAPIPPVSG